MAQINATINNIYCAKYGYYSWEKATNNEFYLSKCGADWRARTAIQFTVPSGKICNSLTLTITSSRAVYIEWVKAFLSSNTNGAIFGPFISAAEKEATGTSGTYSYIASDNIVQGRNIRHLDGSLAYNTSGGYSTGTQFKFDFNHTLSAGTYFIYLTSSASSYSANDTTSIGTYSNGDSFFGSVSGTNIVLNVTDVATKLSKPGKPSGFSNVTHIRNELNLSWGASTGTGNSASSYTVQYSIDNSTAVSTVATNSINLSSLFSEANRGKTIKARVQAISNLSSTYNSDWSDWSTETIISSLPKAPTLSTTRVTVASTTTNYSVIVTDNGDPDRDSTKLQYSTDKSTWTDWQSTNSLATPAEGNTITYYFSAYHSGVISNTTYEERSPTVSITIERNTKPTGSVNLSLADNVFTFSSLSNPKNATVTYEIRRAGTSIYTSSSSSFSLNANNGFLRGYSYTGYIILNDGIETNTIQASGSGSYLEWPSITSIQALSNTDLPITDFSNVFYQRLKVTLSSIKNLNASIYIKNGNRSFTPSASLTDATYKLVLDREIPIESYYISCNLSDTKTGETKTINSSTWNQINYNASPFGTFELNPTSNFNPFSQNFLISTVKTSKTTHYISNPAYTFNLYYDNNSTSISTTYNDSGDSRVFNFGKIPQKIFESLAAPRVGIYNIIVKSTIVNDFGKTYTVQKTLLVTPKSLLDITSGEIRVLCDDSTTILATTSQTYMEGNTFKIHINWSSYHNATTSEKKFKLSLIKKVNDISVAPINNSYEVEYGDDKDKYAINSYSCILSDTIEPITTSDSKVVYEVKITDANNESFSKTNYIELKLGKIDKPTINLSNGKIEEGATKSVITFSNSAAANIDNNLSSYTTLTNKYSYSVNNGASYTSVTSTNNSFEINTPDSSINIIYLKCKTTTTTKVTQDSKTLSGTTTKENEAILAIYRSAPTLSYRQNILGINTRNIDSLLASNANALILISPTSVDGKPKDLIRFIVQADGNYLKVDGFEVDGGGW